MTAPPAPQSDSKPGFWFVHEPNFKYVIAGVPIVVGVLLFLAFFVTSWFSVNEDNAKSAVEGAVNGADDYVESVADDLDMDEDDVRDRLVDRHADVDKEYSKSAWQIWTGSDKEAILRVDEDYDFGDDGFGEVDSRDRILILIPLLAIGLVAVGGLYVADRLDQRMTLMATIGIALLLFILPLLWEGLKTSYIRGEFSDQIAEFQDDDDFVDDQIDLTMAAITSAYATFEFVFLSFIALLFSAGTYLILQSEYKRLGTGWPGKAISPQPPPPAAPQPPPPAA